MKMNKLELKHIAPYLPYGLEAVEIHNGKVISDEFTIDVVNWDGSCVGGSDASLDSYELVRSFSLRDIKPILRPIGSITKEEALEFGILLTNENEMNDKEIGIGSLTLGDMVIPTIYYQDTQDDDFSIMIQFGGVGIGGRDLIPFEAYNWLFENHFDVFGLIEKELAIDKNTIE